MVFQFSIVVAIFCEGMRVALRIERSNKAPTTGIVFGQKLCASRVGFFDSKDKTFCTIGGCMIGLWNW